MHFQLAFSPRTNALLLGHNCPQGSDGVLPEVGQRPGEVSAKVPGDGR